MKNKLIKIGSIITVVIVLVTMTVIPTFAADEVTFNGETLLFNDTPDLSALYKLSASTTANSIKYYIFSSKYTYDNTIKSFIYLGVKSSGGVYTLYFSNGTSNPTEVYNSRDGWIVPSAKIITVSGAGNNDNNYIKSWVKSNTTEYVPVPTSIFYLTYDGNTSSYTFVDGMTWLDWVNSSYNTLGAYVTSVTNDEIFNDIIAYGEFEVDGKTYLKVIGYDKGSGVFVGKSEIIVAGSYYDTYGEYIANADYYQGYHDGYGYGYNEGYNAGFGDGAELGGAGSYDDGYSDGRDSGYQEGFQAGMNAAASEQFGENLLGSTLKGPVEALNQFVLFGTGDKAVTLGGVIGAVIALSLFLIFLKMFNGG